MFSEKVDSTNTPVQNTQALDFSFNHKMLGLHLKGVFSVVGLKNGEVKCAEYTVIYVLKSC